MNGWRTIRRIHSLGLDPLWAKTRVTKVEKLRLDTEGTEV